MAFNQLTNSYEIVLVIYMTNKSESLYNATFSAIKSWFKFNYNVELSPDHVLVDFEKSAINAIIDVFRPRYLYGCYFHAVQNWWKKAAKYGKPFSNPFF